MKEAVVLLMTKDDIDNALINELLIRFPQLIDVKKVEEPFNTRIHLRSETIEDLEYICNEIIPRFEDFRIKDLLTIADDW